MSLFMRIGEPRETRKSILQTKITTLTALKKCEEHARLRRDLRREYSMFNGLFLSVTPKAKEIKRDMPGVEVDKMSFTGGSLRCDLCGKAFKSEHGLNQHMRIAHKGAKADYIPKKGINELDKLDRQIAMLERQLNRM